MVLSPRIGEKCLESLAARVAHDFRGPTVFVDLTATQKDHA